MQNCRTPRGVSEPPAGPRSPEDIPGAAVAATIGALFVAIRAGASQLHGALTRLELGYTPGQSAGNDAVIRVVARGLWTALQSLEDAAQPPRPAAPPDDAAENRALVVARFWARGDAIAREHGEQLERTESGRHCPRCGLVWRSCNCERNFRDDSEQGPPAPRAPSKHDITPRFAVDFVRPLGAAAARAPGDFVRPLGAAFPRAERDK